MDTTIDLIESYLNNLLAQKERLAFEDRLASDKDLNDLYIEHLIMLNAIERTQLITEISKAKSNFYRLKWFKFFGILATMCFAGFLAFTIYNSTKTPILESQTSDVIKKGTHTNLEVVVKDSVKLNNAQQQVINDTMVTNASVKSIVEIPKVKERTDVNSLFESFKKQPEIFSINTNTQVTLELKEGTKIVIPAHAFVDEKSKQTIVGNVDFKVIEYYELTDILLANLSTVCNDQVLETGGMLFIEATQNGNNLVLKQDKSIAITFNTDKDGMDLFNGSLNGDFINWERSTGSYDELAINEESVIPIAQVEFAPTYPECKNLTNEQRKACTMEQINKEFRKRFDTSIVSSSMTNGSERIDLLFDVDTQGNISNVSASASSQKLISEAIRVTKLIPQMIPASHKGAVVSVRFGFPLVITNLDNNTNTVTSTKLKNEAQVKIKSLDTIQSSNNVIVRGFTNDSGTQQKQFNEIQEALDQNTDSDSIVNKVDGNTIERFVLSSAQLGWINCDRFAMTAIKTIRLKLDIKNASGSNVKMIFKSISSILPSRETKGSFDFGSVPQNEEVVIIAIRKMGTELFLAQKVMTTGQESRLVLDFKKVTLDVLKEQIQLLNPAFN